MAQSESAAAKAQSSDPKQQTSNPVSLLCAAILDNDQTASTLTWQHLSLVQSALRFHEYEQALLVLDKPIFYLQSEARSLNLKPAGSLQDGIRKLRYQDVMEYFLSAGMIYIGLHNWEKALDMLEIVITYPMKDSSVSKIMVDAYKKWVLVSVLIYGQASKLPSTTNAAAAKSFRILAKPYDVVAAIFKSGKSERLRDEVIAGSEIWFDDNNTGLMTLILAAHQEFQIRSLAKIYRSISVSNITRLTDAAQMGSRLQTDADTRMLVAQMIDNGQLQASLSQTSNGVDILTFSSSGPEMTEIQAHSRISSSMQRIKAMADDIKTADRRLLQHPEHLKWARSKKNFVKTTSPEADMAWTNGGASEEDEDLMGGGR